MANTIKQIGIKDSAGAGYDNRDIGAEAQNVEVSFNSQGGIIEDITEPGVVVAETKGVSEVAKDLQTQVDNKAPAAHTSVVADSNTLGHVKVGNGLEQDVNDRLCVTYGSSAGSAAEGNDPRLADARKNPKAVTFSDGKATPTTVAYDGSAAKTISYANVGAAPTNHASSSTTYGVASASNYGHVKIGTGLSVSNGVAAVNFVAAGGTDSNKAVPGSDARLSDARKPKSHIATGTTYGGATAAYYGHAKLSDTYDSLVSGGAAANGVAASQNALYNAYNELNNNFGTISSNISNIVENEATASQILNTGSYILRNNQLYRVTTTIASGSVITEGVNIESVTVGDEITNLSKNILSSNHIDLTNYTYNNPYTIPADGYIQAFSPYNAPPNTTAVIYSIMNNQFSFVISAVEQKQQINKFNTVFVKKGMKLYSVVDSTLNKALFIPLV